MRSFIYIFTLLCCAIVVAQEEETRVAAQEIIEQPVEDPLRPSTAAFYSAILPGLGQAYNKRYWKIPIVYGAIGTSMYFYFERDDEYNRFRDAYRRRLAGFSDDEFSDAEGNALVSTAALQRAQENAARNRDIAVIVSIGFYLLNVIDANVDGHLITYTIDDNLSFEPYLEFDPINARPNYGFSLNYTF